MIWFEKDDLPDKANVHKRFFRFSYKNGWSIY